MSHRDVGWLTPQQRRVLELIANGLDHRQIASVMEIGWQSVRNHIVNICDKFFAKDEHFKSMIQNKLLEDKDV